MRVRIFTKFPTKRVEQLMKKHGITPCQSKPDVVICWGGDGTFLLAEHVFPGVPKVIVRKNSICKKCNGLTMEELIPLLAKMDPKKIPCTHYQKLEAVIKKKSRTLTLPLATNDYVIRNSPQMHALRFFISAGKKIVVKDVIGDGIVASTPFGSTSYFHSITGDIVESGFGVAFNNPMIPTSYLLCDTPITLTVNRGGALVSVDTLRKAYAMTNGDSITIRPTKKYARIIAF